MYTMIAPPESNNNAELKISNPPNRLSSSLQYSSEESLQQRFIAQNFHCFRRNTKKLIESDSPTDDPSLQRYFMRMMPPMPTKYQHQPSPHKRVLRHVLQSKMRLWHYKRHPFSIVASRPDQCNPDQGNASNLTIECLQSQTAGACQYHFAIGSSVGWCATCCCQTQLAIAKEHAIVHCWQSLSNLAVVAASGIRVQTARRIQRLNMSNNDFDATQPRPGLHQQVDSHQAVSLSRSGGVEVQSLLTLRPPLRAAGSRSGHLRVKQQLPEDASALIASVKVTDAAPTHSVVAMAINSPLRNACTSTVEQSEQGSRSAAVACATHQNDADINSSNSCERYRTSSRKISCSCSSSRFSCGPLASDQETTLRQSDWSPMTTSAISRVSNARFGTLAIPAGAAVVTVADEGAFGCMSQKCERLRATEAAQMQRSRGPVACRN